MELSIYIPEWALTVGKGMILGVGLIILSFGIWNLCRFAESIVKTIKESRAARREAMRLAEKEEDRRRQAEENAAYDEAFREQEAARRREENAARLEDRLWEEWEEAHREEERATTLAAFEEILLRS